MYPNIFGAFNGEEGNYRSHRDTFQMNEIHGPRILHSAFRILELVCHQLENYSSLNTA